MMKILNMRWKGEVRAKEKKKLVFFSAFLQISFFSLPWEQISCLSDAAVQIPEFSSMKLILHQHHSCSEVLHESCALDKAVRHSNGVRAFL